MKENWKVGKHKSCVVSDVKQKNTNFPIPPNKVESEDSEIEFYGGYLVCESIGNGESAKLIALAPEMLATLKTVCSRLIGVDDALRSYVEDIIKKVKNEP